MHWEVSQLVTAPALQAELAGFDSLASYPSAVVGQVVSPLGCKPRAPLRAMQVQFLPTAPLAHVAQPAEAAGLNPAR